jgi:AcrR family transcriptional regulator
MSEQSSRAKSRKTAPTEKPKRLQGRPSSKEDLIGREKLLDAAEIILRTIPPAKITRNEIAEAAGVNPSLIRYYFRDKDSLLTALASRIIDKNLKILRDTLSFSGTAREKLEKRILLFLKIHNDYPFYHQLIYEQLWLGKSDFQKRVRFDIVGPFFSELNAIYNEGRANGEFRDLEPRFLHVAIIGVCDLFINAPYMIKELFGKEEIDRELIDEYGSFVVNLIFKGIAK